MISPQPQSWLTSRGTATEAIRWACFIGEGIRSVSRRCWEAIVVTAVDVAFRDTRVVQISSWVAQTIVTLDARRLGRIRG